MQIELTDAERTLLQTIGTLATQQNTHAAVIGGWVRDKILNRPTTDVDIVTTGNSLELAEKSANELNPKPTVNYFKNFGTAQFSWNNTDVEFVTARKESYRAESRKPTVEAGTMQDDVDRRDFTINTLRFVINNESFGEIIDPYEGIAAIRAGIIKTPLDPHITFSDDPLRMLRAIRFAAQLNFTVESETLQAISANANRLEIISAERIADEFNKILMTEKPSIGLDLLYKTGLLNQFFPQFTALAGSETIDGNGHKDNFYHTLQVIDNIAVNTDNLWLRWAALLHDIGKPATKRYEEGTGFTFHGHEVVGAKMVPKIFNQFKLSTHEPMRYVQKLVNLHLRPIGLSKEEITDSAIRRLLFDAGQDFDDLILLCQADITSKNPNKVKRYLQNFEIVKERSAEVEAKDHLRNWQPPVSGEQIMQRYQLKPSQIVGSLKESVRNAILDGKIDNTYKAAILWLDEVAAKKGLKKVES